LRPGAVEPGEIVHLDGTVLGTHNGVIDYTIGQRRGLGIGGRKDADESDGPLYVVGIDAGTHKVIVGPQSALACHEVILSETIWTLSRGAPAVGAKVLARLRNTAPAMPATLSSVADDTAVLHLDERQFGIATGQAAVLYDVTDNDVVLGGGWITAAPTIVIA
jgi:tRNA-specific 2-thiouridylase